MSTSPYIAILFVAFPGMGKTSVARRLVQSIPGMVHIEQDQFYHNGRCDVNGYLEAIENAVQSSNVVFGKNHHDQKSLGEVLDVLHRQGVKYFIYNFVPTGFSDLTKEEQEPLITELLNRIEKRSCDSSDLSSPLRISASSREEDRKRARGIIIHGFVKKYEEPLESYVSLDYRKSVQDQVDTILTHLYTELSKSPPNVFYVRR
jgi:adenylate kinase family enzyme